MFEDRTRENLKKDMLGELNQSSGLNTLEGGFADQVFGPVAVQLEKVYTAMDGVLAMMSVDETCGELIDVAAGNFSVARKDGAAAAAKIRFNGASGAYIPADTRFATQDGLTYILAETVVLDSAGAGNGLLVAQEVGNRYNVPAGAISQMYVNLAGLDTFWAEAATGGVDPEGDAALVGRYYDKLRRPVTSGNPNHYRQWAMEVAGVGEAKVISLANGPGTVGITLVSEDFGPVDATVAAAAVAHIEKERPAGISAAPNVKSAQPLTINVAVVSKLDTTVTTASVAAALKTRLEKYFRDLVAEKYALTYDDATDDRDYTLSYNRVATILMTTPGVVDYTSLTLNGAKTDITIGKDQVPALGEVAVT